MAETRCYELAKTPIPHPLALLRGRRLEKKLSPGRREGWGEGVFRFVLISSLEKRRLGGDLRAAFQYLKGTYRKDGEGL